MLNGKTNIKMENILNRTENRYIINALKKMKETQWVGNVEHPNLDYCLTAINLFTGANSGWYNPKAIRINGVMGTFMVNESGLICWEARVIKKDEKRYLIEYLCNSAVYEFERYYSEQIQ